jgi:hypothetical protein
MLFGFAPSIRHRVDAAGASIGTDQGQAGLVQLCLVKSRQPARQHGNDVDKFVLMRCRGQANAEAAFLAIWCPNAQNDVRTCTLDNGASLMFTPTMDGCTFVVTGQDAHGNCSVGHANSARFGANCEAAYGLAGARQFQADEQTNRLRHSLGVGGGAMATINPRDYMADFDGEMVRKSTTFAIRTAGTWRFDTQTCVIQGGRCFLRSVDQRI